MHLPQVVLLSMLSLSFPEEEPQPQKAALTYSRDIAPIFQAHCQGCHRQGEIGEMSLMSYKEVRPWVRSIRKAVRTAQMPPWGADPRYGKFKNDVSLSIEEINKIIKWIDGGAIEGDSKDLPAPRKFTPGWVIGKPDAVFSMAEAFEVPARGTVPYKYFVVPTGFKKDRWVRAAEVRPGARDVVHHVIVFVSEPEDRRKKGVTATPEARARGLFFSNLLCGTAPGEGPDFFPPGSAKLVKAGSDLIFQCHYTPNGKPARDRSKVGFVFAEKPVRRVYTRAALNSWFKIPPGEKSHKVSSKHIFRQDIWLVSLMAHMHLRGKSFRFDLYRPGEKKQTLLNVPAWDFNWQTHYLLEKPLSIPAGSRVECTAYFDNSAGNPANPDPSQLVRWGDQTWEEMMIGYLNFVRQDEDPIKPEDLDSDN